MFKRLKQYKFGSYIVLAATASMSKIVSSVGAWLFSMEKAMPRFDGTIDTYRSTMNYTTDTYQLSPQHSNTAYLITLYGAMCCGTLLTLTVLPQTFQHYYPKDSDVSAEEKSASPSVMEQGYGAIETMAELQAMPNSYSVLVGLGWIGFAFQTLALFNGSLKLFDFARGSENTDPNKEALSVLMLATLNAGFQCLANYASNQKILMQNARSSEKILEFNSVSLLILIDCIVAAMFAYMSALGALGKIPFQRLGLSEISKGVKTTLAITALIATGSSRLLTNGVAIKHGFNKRPASPTTSGGKAYYAATTFVGLPDALFTGVNALGASLYLVDPSITQYQLSDMWCGNFRKAAVVSVAVSASAIYATSTWFFNTSSRREQVLKGMSKFAKNNQENKSSSEMSKLVSRT